MSTTNIITVETLPPISYQYEAFCFKFYVRNFENIFADGEGGGAKSPEFACFGHRWKISVYPCGEDYIEDIRGAFTSVFLELVSVGKIEIYFQFTIGGSVQGGCEEFEAGVENSGRGFGFPYFDKRCYLLHDLVDGNLIVEVRMKMPEPKDLLSRQFIPPNPLPNNIQKTFNDEKTADVLFVVGGQSKDGKKKAKTPATKFFAHRVILKSCAPILAGLCEAQNDKSTLEINDVRPEIFRLLLQYIYGGKIPEEDLKKDATEIIDSADKYGVVGLKLEAEACYIDSTIINTDNVVDILLYADAKNCALLNEVAMDYIFENKNEVLGKVSFASVPGDMLSDLLASVTRGTSDITSTDNIACTNFNSMRVSTLRRMCYEKGLEVDGSRKTMVALLKNTHKSNC